MKEFWDFARNHSLNENDHTMLIGITLDWMKRNNIEGNTAYPEWKAQIYLAEMEGQKWEVGWTLNQSSFRTFK